MLWSTVVGVVVIRCVVVVVRADVSTVVADALLH